jgi:hypothetical protein
VKPSLRYPTRVQAWRVDLADKLPSHLHTVRSCLFELADELGRIEALILKDQPTDPTIALGPAAKLTSMTGDGA